VPKILNSIDCGRRINRSRFICKAITEYYQRRRHLFEQYEQGNLSHQELVDGLEMVLPSIAEPLSSFRYEGNMRMYHLMPDELLKHTEQVGHSLINGVDKTHKTKKKYGEKSYEDRDEEGKAEGEQLLTEVIQEQQTKRLKYQQMTLQEKIEQRKRDLEEEMNELMKASSSSSSVVIVTTTTSSLEEHTKNHQPHINKIKTAGLGTIVEYLKMNHKSCSKCAEALEVLDNENCYSFAS
jgi:hypothetical protein